MRMTMRVALVVSIVLVGTIGQAVPALGSAHGPTAGSFSSESLFANYTASSDDFTQPQIILFLTDRSTTSNPLDGPRTSSSQMQVSFTALANGQEDSGCFLLDASDFVISADLSSASLHKTVTADSPTCDFPPNLNDPEVTLDITWTGVGPANSFHTTGHSGCPGYQVETLSTTTSNRAAATASITPLIPGPISATRAVLSSSNLTNHIQGTSPALCGIPGATGTLGLTQPPGKYETISKGAGQQLTNAESGDQLEVNAGMGTSVSDPKVGPSTSTTLTSVNISLIPSFQSGCFLIDSSAFNVAHDLSGATLHVRLTDATPTCDSSPATLPLPLTVEVTYTGTGPVGTNNLKSWEECGAFRSEQSTSSANNNSSAVATLSEAINESFASTQSANESSGTLGTQDTTTHFEGTLPSGCLF